MSKEQQDQDGKASNATADSAPRERGADTAPAGGDDSERRRPAEGGELPSARIGPYQVVKQVGEGVAGIVFQAEQQEPVRLLVALKVIKEGWDWRQIVARFEAERPSLSLLDHPNIAKVLGAGARQSGQPYFVTEWVDGVALTQFCDEHRLPLRQRLELFIPVCQAVQYAHHKGVIHGDLKPSNVLAAGPEDKPAPKVLDFGVARATRPKPSETVPSTAPGGLVGNPEYLSPDQTDANIPDVDTRGDVYSLGVLLYELLTGTTPVRAERLRGISLMEALRLIRAEEIPPPSKRLDDSKECLASASAKRNMKPAVLVKAVRGELDCLVMKALHKDRARRYETVHDLARDVQRYLDHEPLEACPPNTKQQLWQMARKHSRLSMAAALVCVLLLAVTAASGGVAVWAWHEKGQAQKAEKEAADKQKKAQQAETEIKGKLHLSEAARKAMAQERDRARTKEKEARSSEEETKAVLLFLKDRLLSAGRPAGTSIAEAFWAAGQAKDVTLRQAVDKIEPKVAEMFADRPLAEASIREMLGWAYVNVGEAAQAVKQYERAFALRKAWQGVNDFDTADCRAKLAVVYRLADRPVDAARLFEHNPNSSARASALAFRGTMLLSQKKPVEAELKLRECLTIRQKVQPDDWTTFDTKSMLGEALLEQSKYTEAEPLLLSGYEGLKQHEATIPSQDQPRVTKAVERLVQLYEAWGKMEKAAKWRKTLEEAKRQ